MRAGGVAMIRHARAPGTGDPARFRLDDCATQRNLSAEGRAQAESFGQQIHVQGVTVSRVLHSRWCRARDTAVLAFPKLSEQGLVTPEPALDSFFGDLSREVEQTDAARDIIASWAGPGALILSTHQVNITAITGMGVREGEAMVFQPTANGIEFVGSIQF
ncbi:MAG: histidine phosphatase family protein [Rhodobacteraceae bacterium]|nr:histidine phosphatase family protein [Paracoccaceae bacterium]